MAQYHENRTEEYERRITEWLRLGMMLLIQTVVVALFLGKIFVDVDYLKTGLAESRTDQFSIREQIKALGVLEYRLNQCTTQIETLHRKIEKHAAGDKE